MGNTRVEGLLNIPTLGKPTRESIKTRQKAVDAWIAELPRADHSQYARRIFDHLQEINSLDISKKERLYILQALRSPINEISENFRRHFVNDALPLSPKNQALAEFTVSLNVEMAVGYKIIIEQSWTQKLTWLTRKPVTELLYWAIHYLSEVLLTTYQVYVEHPANSWVDLHQFYLFAEENKLENTKLRGADREIVPPESTISQRYKQILLLGLISPYRLRQHIIEKVYYALEHWAGYSAIKPADSYDSHSQHILVRMNSDANPGYHVGDQAFNREYTRVLDASPLIHLLSEQILHQAAAENDIRMIDLAPETMKLLMETWSGQSKRNFARTPGNNQLNVSVGINATHHLISTLRKEKLAAEQKDSAEEEVPQTDAGSKTLKLADTLELTSNAKKDTGTELTLEEFDDQPSFNASVIAYDAPDVWNPTYTSKSVDYDNSIKQWLEQKQKQKAEEFSQPEPFHCDNVNESANGYCLIAKFKFDSHTNKMQIGDAVGIHAPTTKNDPAVGVGFIRRIKNCDSEMAIGIQKLAPFANAVEIARYHPQISRRRFVRSLMLPGIKSINQPVTILVQQRYRTGEPIVIKKNGHQTLVKLTKQIETTGVVHQFEFEIEKDLGSEREQEVDSPNTAKFDNVWSLI